MSNQEKLFAHMDNIYNGVNLQMLVLVEIPYKQKFSVFRFETRLDFFIFLYCRERDNSNFPHTHTQKSNECVLSRHTVCVDNAYRACFTRREG
jgi:hypothetical protein